VIRAGCTFRDLGLVARRYMGLDVLAKRTAPANPVAEEVNAIEAISA
jgi:hypothetical protein